MNTTSINPWVLCIPHKSDNYHKHQFLNLIVPKHKNNTNLTVLDSLSARPILPIFKNRGECTNFKTKIISDYDVHANPWYVLPGFESSDELPDRCRMVRVQSHCANKTFEHIHMVSKVPFDLHDENVVTAMSLQSNTGFLVINRYEMSTATNLLTLHGILVDSAFTDVSNDEYLVYIADLLEDSLGK